MTEYDLRKLPLHRMYEAKEKAKIILLQRAYERKIKLTRELLDSIDQQLDDMIDDINITHGELYWMDFGERFIEEIINGQTS